MATIFNNSRFTLAINGNEFSGTVNRGASIEVPNDVAQAWLSKPTPAVFLAEGLVRVAGLDAVQADASVPTAKSKSEPKANAPVHWRTMLKTVKDATDLDALQDLHANEKRPRILTAIETRMAELQGA